MCDWPQNLPPFTHEVQRWIYDRQNPGPGACGRQKYLLGYLTDKQGLGSTFHVAANFLGNALHVRCQSPLPLNMSRRLPANVEPESSPNEVLPGMLPAAARRGKWDDDMRSCCTPPSCIDIT